MATIQQTPIRRTNRAGKQLVCDICNRAFTKADHLERHARTHTKEKPFKCPECGRCYSRHDTLLRHQREHDDPDTNTDPNSGLMELSSTDDLAMTPFDIIQDVNGSTLTSLPGNPTTLSDHSMNPPAASSQAFNASFHFMDDQSPAWLFADGFDLNLLDFPFEGATIPLTPAPLQPMTEQAPVEPRTASDLSDVWFTNIPEGPSSGAATPTYNRTEVDDHYRKALHHRLSIRPVEHHLPSAEFLNTCIRLYFLRFHPILPIVHRPTFRPSQGNTTLLLSICSIGSLFCGSANAYKLGTQLYESLQKSSLARWETTLNRGKDEAIALVQSALIGQTFGMLSGDPKHLLQNDALHGTVIAWARRVKMLHARHIPFNPNLTGPGLEEAWQTWVRTEVCIRVNLGLHVHDAELANIFRHEALLRHGPHKGLAESAPEDIFMAVNAQEWKSRYLTSSSATNAFSASPASVGTPERINIGHYATDRLLTSYAILQGITLSVLEHRLSEQQMTHTKEVAIEEDLMSFYRHFLSFAIVVDPVDLQILWHLTFMELCTDFEVLECSIGREGPVIEQSTVDRARTWATSTKAVRCILHGSMILKLVEARSLVQEPSLHTARALFLSAVSWYAFSKYAPPSLDVKGHLRTGYRELQLLGIDTASLLSDICGYKPGRRSIAENSGLLCRVTDILQRIGHWEVARKFSSILRTLINDGIG